MKKPILLAAASFLATAALIKAAPALAEPAQGISVVHTNDLDLSTGDGRARLDRRLVIAADQVCGTAADVDLAGRNAVRTCRFDVLERARHDGQQLAARGGERVIVTASR